MSAEYDALANDYDASFQALTYRMHIEAWSVFQALGAVAGLRVLELACGTGSYARLVRQQGAAEVVGVDLSAGMIAQAEAIEQAQPLGITYHVHDVGALELGKQFDVVLAVYLLHYAHDHAHLAQMAATIAKHLVPGGRLVAYQMNPVLPADPDYYADYGLRLQVPADQVDGAGFSFSAKLGPDWTPPISTWYWSEAAITKALEAAGLINIAWSKPSLAPSQQTSDQVDHWQAYLDMPHCLILQADKPV